MEEDIRCLVSVDGLEITATITHLRRGKFKILNDEDGGKYAGRIVDASDVLRCYI